MHEYSCQIWQCDLIRIGRHSDCKIYKKMIKRLIVVEKMSFMMLQFLCIYCLLLHDFRCFRRTIKNT